MTQDVLLSNEASLTQHYIFDCCVEIIFHDIIPDTSIVKVLTVRKSQIKTL